jgi:SAM-dependent methyltransferase
MVSSSRGGTPITSLPPGDSPPPDLAERLAVPRFPRCAGYDPAWVIANQMGPNVLWLTEFLSQAMDLRPGMRVLDMGCGKALSSIFLAREFGVQVWATDLWIPAADNLERVQEADLEDRVFPVHAEAHALPFAVGFFDAVLSVDAYHYFGTDDLYLGYVARFVKPDAQIGIVVPDVRQEIGSDIPPSLRPLWNWDFGSFHSTAWWRAHWEKTGLVEIATADTLPNGWEIWLQWEEMWEKIGHPSPHGNLELLHADTDHLLGFSRLVARRRAEPLYPSPLYSS